MNVFDSVKESVTTREAAEAFGIPVRHNGMCCCPFHGEKNPSMKVDRRFHCFACGEDGDVIDFTAKLYNLSRKDAALRLAGDFRISYDEWKPQDRKHWAEERLKPRPKSEEQIYREKEHHFFREISDYYHVLRDWKEKYQPAQADEKWDERFSEAVRLMPRLERIMDEFLAADRAGREEMFRAYAGTEKYCAEHNAQNAQAKKPHRSAGIAV